MVLVSNAYAQVAGVGGAEGGLLSFLPLVLMFVVMYFLMIRPQMKRQKEHRVLLEGLQKGDEVLAAGGLMGKVTKLGDSYITLEIASLGEKPVEVLVQRSSVATVLPKGTLKSN
jgi:preprotein translocase subunit YajC